MRRFMEETPLRLKGTLIYGFSISVRNPTLDEVTQADETERVFEQKSESGRRTDANS